MTRYLLFLATVVGVLALGGVAMAHTPYWYAPAPVYYPAYPHTVYVYPGHPVPVYYYYYPVVPYEYRDSVE